MANAQNAIWPLPKFNFQVDFAPAPNQTPAPAKTAPTLTGISFQEISGLEAETQIIEYRHSNNLLFSTIKMPGIAKYGNVTMKNGIFVNDNSFWTWYSLIAMNTVSRMVITIKLLDETMNPTMTWALSNAWVTKIQGTDLKSDGNEVAIQTIEFAHEQLTVSNGAAG